MGIEFCAQTNSQIWTSSQDALSILTCMNNVNSLILLIQDKVPRMCAYSASGSSDSDSDPDYGDNGFGAGRGKLVKAMKSATPGNTRRAPRKFREALSWVAFDHAFHQALFQPHLDLTS